MRLVDALRLLIQGELEPGERIETEEGITFDIRAEGLIVEAGGEFRELLYPTIPGSFQEISNQIV